MAVRFRALLRLDLSAIDLRKGVMGLGAILAFGIFVAIFGAVGMVAAMALLFVILADQPGSCGIAVSASSASRSWARSSRSSASGLVRNTSWSPRC